MQSMVRGYFRAFGACALVLLAGCQHRQAISNDPPLTPTTDPIVKRENDQLALAAAKPTDPSMCQTEDANAKGIGNLSYMVPLSYENNAVFDDLYSRILVETEICETNIGSTSRSKFRRVINALGVNNANTISSRMTITGLVNNIQYPQLYPFSYAYDEKESVWKSSMLQKLLLPWQPATGGYTVSYEYKASDATSFTTAEFMTGILNDAIAINPSTALFSPATTTLINTAAKLVDKIASKSLTSGTNETASSHQIDFQSKDRGFIIRFKNTDNIVLAAIKISTVLTNTLARQNPISPVNNSEGATPKSNAPSFKDYPQILSSITLSSGRTLRDDIAKEDSYKEIIKSSSSTAPANFRSSCDALEVVLKNTYRLNKYDAALAMGDVLRRSAYVTTRPLHDSCFIEGRQLLNEMGLGQFIKLSPEIIPGIETVDLQRFCSLRNLGSKTSNSDKEIYRTMFTNSVFFTNFDSKSFNTSGDGVIDWLIKSGGTINSLSCQLKYFNESRTEFIASYTIPGVNGAKDVYEIVARGFQRDQDNYDPVETGIGWWEVKKIS